MNIFNFNNKGRRFTYENSYLQNKFFFAKSLHVQETRVHCSFYTKPDAAKQTQAHVQKK